MLREIKCREGKGDFTQKPREWWVGKKTSEWMQTGGAK
jgi:hypothetical protein